MKTIDTLVDDIYEVVKNDAGISFGPELFNEFGSNLSDLFGDRFNRDGVRPPSLRMSSIGRRDRQIWYDLNPYGAEEELPAQTLIKFSYGDMIEQMILLYAKLAGHSVEMEQAEVEVNGIKGHIDAIIDGVVVDIKSASSYSWKKFDTGEYLKPENDAFGYLAQMAGYVEALTPGKEGAFLAVDKTLGKLTLLRVPPETLANYRVRDRIDHLREMVKGPVPERCFPDVPDGKSGNMKLDTGCSYCKHKFECWPEIQTFLYSTGPRYLTKVVRQPKVNVEFPD